MTDHAQAFWIRSPGQGEIRPVALPEPGDGDVVVRTLRSGVSRRDFMYVGMAGGLGLTLPNLLKL